MTGRLGGGKVKGCSVKRDRRGRRKGRKKGKEGVATVIKYGREEAGGWEGG